MNVIPENIRSQLAPSWSGVNIAIMIVLLIVMFPLGLLMIAYILFGQALGIDLGHPETFTTAFQRIGRAFDAGVAEFNGQPNPVNRTTTATPENQTAPTANTGYTAETETSAAQAVRTEAQDLQAQREALEADRRRLEAEKAAFYQRRDRESD